MNLAKKCLSAMLAALLALAALPIAHAEPDAAAELLLAAVTDIRYYPDSLAQYRSEDFFTYMRGSDCVYANLNGVLDSAFDALADHARENGLKYLVICGDLTVGGEYEGHVQRAEKLRAFEEETGIRVYVINGDRDVNNPDAAAFTEPDGRRREAKRTSPSDFYNIYYEFGYNEAVSVFCPPDSGKAGALSYAVCADGYRLILIDAGKYTEDAKPGFRDMGGGISPELLEWVRTQALQAKEAGETPVAFTHWNVCAINGLPDEATPGGVQDGAYRLRDEFADMGIHYLFSGHVGASDIGAAVSDAGEPLYSVGVPALSRFPNAYRLTAFSADANGNVTADFRQYDCARTRVVSSSGGTPYLSPYREAGFYLQYAGGDAAQYLLWKIKEFARPYLEGVRNAGGIIPYLKEAFGVDVEAELQTLFRSGAFAGDDVFTADRLIALADDLDAQLTETYVKQPDRLWNALEKLLTDLASVSVSDVPCTKFMDTYGFGSRSRSGTLGDLFLSAAVYAFSGGEDISDDAFVCDVLDRAGDPAFIDLLLDSAEKYIAEDFLVDEVLANLYVHVNTLFNTSDATGLYVSQYLQFMYRLGGAVAGEDAFSASSPLEFARNLLSLITYLTLHQNSVSYKYLLESVLSSGAVRYGTTVGDAASAMLESYFPRQNREAAAERLSALLNGLFIDETEDFDVCCDYAGPVPPIPSVEDMRLPSDLTLRYENGVLTVGWLTKYSVTGTQIEIREEETGEPVTDSEIETLSKPDVYTVFGFSFGSFGVLPYPRDIVRHRVSVAGLTPGTTYVYRVGDSEKGFWSREAAFTVPDENGPLTLLMFSGFAPSNTAAAEAFAYTLGAAADAHPDAAAVLLGGPCVLNGADDGQYSAVINAAAGTLSALPQLYVTGPSDGADAVNVRKHYTLSDGQGTVYSYDIGNVHIAVPDTNRLDADGTLPLSQVLWLREDLDASAAMWKLVVINAPAVSGDSAATPLSRQITDICESMDVDLLLETGAKAVYRSHMIKNGKYLPIGDKTDRLIGGRTYSALTNGGVAVLAGGTAGADYEPAVPDKTRFAAAVTQTAPVYTALTFYENDVALDTWAVSTDGTREQVDSFAVFKDGGKCRLGDVDGDDRVTAADARLALRCSVGLETLGPVQKLAADVDGSRSVTAADARAILRHAVELERISPAVLQYSQQELDQIDF